MDGFLTLRQAREQRRVNHRTLRRMIADAGVPIYENPADRRVLLVRAADLEKVSELRPISRPGKEGHPSPTAA